MWGGGAWGTPPPELRCCSVLCYFLGRPSNLDIGTTSPILTHQCTARADRARSVAVLQTSPTTTQQRCASGEHRPSCNVLYKATPSRTDVRRTPVTRPTAPEMLHPQRQATLYATKVPKQGPRASSAGPRVSNTSRGPGQRLPRSRLPISSFFDVMRLFLNAQLTSSRFWGNFADPS